ncbi:Pre-rRNA-processing protein TSR2 [Perilla frutescens var. hirtella]|nr:Pre-rRNA-processing protein TSR2 [Perilla frutescens var. hirtella]
MEYRNGKAVAAAAPLSGGVRSQIQERISRALSRWNALQMAVHNKWGGSDSTNKSHQLSSDVFSWLFQTKAVVQVEDLENLLHERLLLTFNTEIEDGSIEEMAEELMSIRDEYLQGIPCKLY